MTLKSFDVNRRKRQSLFRDDIGLEALARADVEKLRVLRLGLDIADDRDGRINMAARTAAGNDNIHAGSSL